MIRLSHKTTVPYTLTRLGVVMTPEPGNPLEGMGVLNPGSGRTPDGRLCLLPRIVADGNVSRVGLAEIVLSDGVPVGVQRQGVVLAPDEGWERGANNAGVDTEGLLATMRNTGIEALLRLNILLPVVLTKYIVRHMMADDAGRISNMS